MIVGVDKEFRGWAVWTSCSVSLGGGNVGVAH